MNKLLTTLLTICFIGSAFAGCSGNGSGSGASTAGKGESTASAKLNVNSDGTVNNPEAVSAGKDELVFWSCSAAVTGSIWIRSSRTTMRRIRKKGEIGHAGLGGLLHEAFYRRRSGKGIRTLACRIFPNFPNLLTRELQFQLISMQKNPVPTGANTRLRWIPE